MSKESGFRPTSLSEQELKSLLVEALDDAPGWKSQETFHARFDHLERGISSDDVYHAIRGNWTFERAPEFNQTEWQWKYRLSAETIDVIR